MDVNGYMINYIKRNIPVEILQVALHEPSQNWVRAPVSMEHLLMTKVIRPRVYVDLDIVGGKLALIDLTGLVPDYVDNFTTVYSVPPDRLDNREILSILGVTYAPFTGHYNTGYGTAPISHCSINDFNSAGQRMMDSHSAAPSVGNALAEIIGFNTVSVRDTDRISPNYHMRVLLSNQDNLANVHPKSYIKIAQLALMATKSFCYNKLIVKMDQGYIVGGQELGVFRDLVSNWSDAETMYYEFLTETMGRVMYTNDRPRTQRLLKRLIHPGV